MCNDLIQCTRFSKNIHLTSYLRHPSTFLHYNDMIQCGRNFDVRLLLHYIKSLHGTISNRYSHSNLQAIIVYSFHWLINSYILGVRVNFPLVFLQINPSSINSFIARFTDGGENPRFI